MPVFANRDGKLQALSALPCNREKELQRLLEANLMEVLELHYLHSEYPTSNGRRIDTLAVDLNGAPVIIEYKRDRNNSVINQALSYLKWLKAQRPEFFRMLMINKLGKDLADSIKLDWLHPRIICVAESFNRYDYDTVEMVQLRIELYRHRQYEDDIFTLDLVSGSEAQTSANSLPQATEDTNLTVIDVVKQQTHASLLVQNLFDELREWILAIDEHILEKPNRRGAAYAVTKHFAEIQIRRDKLVIDLRPIDYQDPRSMVEPIAQGYVVTMNRRIILKDPKDLEYVFGIIRQSYQDVL